MAIERETERPMRRSSDREPCVRAVIRDALLRWRGRTPASGTEIVDLLLELRDAVDVVMRLEALLAPVPS